MKKKEKFNIKEIRQWLNLNRGARTLDIIVQIILMYVDEKFTKTDLTSATVGCCNLEKSTLQYAGMMVDQAFNYLVSQQVIEYTPRQPLVINKSKLMKFMMEK